MLQVFQYFICNIIKPLVQYYRLFMRRKKKDFPFLLSHCYLSI